MIANILSNGDGLLKRVQSVNDSDVLNRGPLEEELAFIKNNPRQRRRKQNQREALENIRKNLEAHRPLHGDHRGSNQNGEGGQQHDEIVRSEIKPDRHAEKREYSEHDGEEGLPPDAFVAKGKRQP